MSPVVAAVMLLIGPHTSAVAERLDERAGDSLDERTERLAAELESASFTVDEGLFDIFEPADCAQLERCWANNPTSPYGFFLLPMAPEEPDPDPENRGINVGTLRPIFRLRPDEAIILVGVTPPPSPYFSFTAYVFSRYTPFARGGPPYEDRVEVFASLGDSQNNLTLNTLAGAGQGAFDQEFILIVTADRGTDMAIRSAAIRAGFAASTMSTLVIPRLNADGSSLVRMGYENEDDLLTVLMRIAHPDAQVPGTGIRAWLDGPGARAFRVRPEEPADLDPYPFPQPRPTGSGESEDPRPLRRLVRRILDAHADSACTNVKVSRPSLSQHGSLCLEWMFPCFADCRDTPYMLGRVKLGPPPEAIIVAGYNHDLSGRASYTNITVTRVADATAFWSVVMRDLGGSAEVYMPRDPDRDKVWQVQFARDCAGEPFCFEVAEDQVPVDGLLDVLTRAYLDPATATSPKAQPYRDSEIVFPRIIKINCPGRRRDLIGRRPRAASFPFTLLRR